MNHYENKLLNNMPDSIFSVMSKLALKHDAVNLGQGFPDFDGPLWLMEEAFAAMKSGKNQYAPSPGILSLRRAVCDYHKKFYDLDWNPDDNVTITAGATEAIYSTIKAFVSPGDEVIMFEPFYDAHQLDTILCGGIPKYVTLSKPDFSFDFNELEALVSDKTKLLIINSPHNPTGKVYSLEELEFIAKLAIKHDFLVMSDEVYEFITFDDARHIPIATVPCMADRTITISSAGKTFSMTGWKIGFTIASKTLTESIRKIHQWTVFAVNTPAQHAVATAFGRLDDYLPDFQAMYLKKRDLINDLLIKTDFKPHKPAGSYFLMADIPANKYQDDMDCAMKLVENNKLAIIPPSVFYGKSEEGKTILRFCFAKNDETIKKGIENLMNLV
ncbi:MAG: aminotransferase class I/II-fold pyridoxal phosphate-dependent enzyme [Candidatus Kapabacteria bacterium]|nr:aminotransferase class I/II-fold pyridoxal phosphate-dependent enzyme [Candidatus Kapabacteria bacterium]